MRTAQIEAMISPLERHLQPIDRRARRDRRLDRKFRLCKQRRDLAALTKLNRALGEQHVFRDIDGSERIIGWHEPKQDRPKCGARTRAGGSCKAPVLRGKARCRMHGGLSTGPRTADGKARCVAGPKAYWERWRAERASAEAK